MFGLVVALFALFSITIAGYLEAPLAYHAPIVAAPIAVKAAVPLATSYQNTFQISAAPVPVLVKAAPIVTAPILYKAAPLFAAPAVHYAAAPAIVKSPLLAAPLPYNYH